MINIFTFFLKLNDTLSKESKLFTEASIDYNMDTCEPWMPAISGQST